MKRGSSRLPRHMPPMNVPEQHAERDSGRPDDELQELEPDDLVDQRGAAAAHEEQQQRRHVPARSH